MYPSGFVGNKYWRFKTSCWYIVAKAVAIWHIKVNFNVYDNKLECIQGLDPYSLIPEDLDQPLGIFHTFLRI